MGDAILLKDQAVRANPDLVPLFDPDLFIDPPAVDKRAVVAAEVPNPETGAKLLNNGMIPGHARVLKNHDVAAVPPDGDAPSRLGQGTHIQILGLRSTNLLFHYSRHKAGKGPVL